MRKNFKNVLIMFLVVALVCFSQVFAGGNKNVKLNKNIKNSKNIKLLDSANDNGFDQYTKLLMHMDEGTFKDECGHGVINKQVTLDTANKKFENGSASFNGNNSSFTVSNSTDFNFADKDFTIDCWVYLNNYNSGDNKGNFIINKHDKGKYNGYYMMIPGTTSNLDNPKKLVFKATTGDTKWDVSLVSAKDFPLQKWTHVEIDRQNGKYSLFINGSLESSTNNSYPLKSSVEDFVIGSEGDSVDYHFYGNIDELRVLKGISAHAAAFTSPSSPYPYDPQTKISLSETTASLILNDPVKGSDTLTATVTSYNEADKVVSWKSSDSGIVQIDTKTGKMIAGKVGTATITAITADGKTATCIVTVTEPNIPVPNPTDISDKAALNITMTNGQVKQYNVTMDVVNKFISWYKLRSSGSGDPFYEFDITQSSNPSIKRTDYVIFDKISSFGVDDYTK